ncbi:MAG TPA: FAD-binding oxidoreductase [Solirubrobacteraceae bacterium]|nr:FAD-binding oxidoreductase [Solirubrobacteraceae bacterium]
MGLDTILEARPATFEAAASMLARAAADGHPVRVRGGGTKLGWGAPGSEARIDLCTGRLSSVVEHNVGDLTAVLEAGVRLADAQERFASASQMLALDPPLAGAGAPDPSATIGGIVATGDSGPLRHRYGGPRDLVLGMTVALSDGTIAHSGGKVIKNVAGYDLAKLFAGSFGTLGLILAVNVRLHPQPAGTATAFGADADPERLAAAARALAAAPLELDALDVTWRSGRGGVLARCAGAEPLQRARRVGSMLDEAGLHDVDVSAEDDTLWERQRAGQRSRDGALVMVLARPSALAGVLTAAEGCDGSVVGRAALGTSYVEVEPDAVKRLLAELPAGARGVVRDGPLELRTAIDPWSATEGPALELMRRVKARFDPAGVCNTGLFVGGI